MQILVLEINTSITLFNLSNKDAVDAYDTGELDKKIKEMLDYDGPVIFDCVVDQDENCYPMIPSGAAHNEMLLGESDDNPEVSDEGKVLI